MSAAAYLRRAWPEHLPWWHTPNGEQRDKATAGKLKGMGVTAGVPDFCLILPNGQATFIELKRLTGDLSKEQDEFRDKVLALRCGYATARSMEEVEAIVTRWLGLFELKPRATIIQRRAA